MRNAPVQNFKIQQNRFVTHPLTSELGKTIKEASSWHKGLDSKPSKQSQSCHANLSIPEVPGTILFDEETL